jgi:acyl-CoA thioesterase FadM
VHGGGALRVAANQVLVLISLEDGSVVPIPAPLKKRFAKFMEPALS